MRRATRARLGVVAAATLLVPAAGCLDYEEVLSIASDGSGTVGIELNLDLSIVADLKKSDPTPDSEDSGDLSSLVSKDEIKKDLDVPGITVKTLEVEDKGSHKTHVKLAFQYKNLDALRSVRFFSDREISVVDQGENVDFIYKYNARSILNMLGLDPAEKPPADEHARKVHAALDEARKASSARFVLTMPGNLVATNGEKTGDRTARFTVDKSKPEAQDRLLREPLKMVATVAKKDAPFWEREKDRKPSSAPESEKPKPKDPASGLGDE
jgi:hypothetical protein